MGRSTSLKLPGIGSGDGSEGCAEGHTGSGVSVEDVLRRAICVFASTTCRALASGPPSKARHCRERPFFVEEQQRWPVRKAVRRRRTGLVVGGGCLPRNRVSEGSPGQQTTARELHTKLNRPAHLPRNSDRDRRGKCRPAWPENLLRAIQASSF